MAPEATYTTTSQSIFAMFLRCSLASSSLHQRVKVCEILFLQLYQNSRSTTHTVVPFTVNNP